MPRCLCANCRCLIEYPLELAGQNGTCPHCHQSVLLGAADPPTPLAGAGPHSLSLKRGSPASDPLPVPPPLTAAPALDAAGESQPSRPAETTAVPSTSVPLPEGPGTAVSALGARLLENIERVVVGKRDRIILTIAAFLSEGHLLLEDVPGVAKTMLARALAQSIGCAFKRLQCTPDLLPTDITGVSVFNPKSTEFEFRPGPIFAQIVLADEINRATPRTQSALLEAMAERSVTVDGFIHSLARPFFLVATQNPIDHEGTFPLPEAQLDRFLMRLSLGYPPLAEEARMLDEQQASHPIDSLTPVARADEIIAGQQGVRQVAVDVKVRDYLLRLVTATREHPSVVLGASPRASLALYRSAQALAALQGYDYVLPDHVKLVAPYVLGHRVIIHPEKRLRKVNAAMVVSDILSQTLVPTVHVPRR